MFLFLTWLAIGMLASFVLGSFYEWSFHRYVMHKPLPGFRYPFETHAVVHHHTFKADHTYHLVHEEDKETIPMAWWNGPALIGLFSLPMLLVAAVTGIWALLVGALVAFTLYYVAYEYIHWCMHLPKARKLEKSALFLKLNGHHLLHHRYMHKNFNVVFPLADLLMGTLMRRSKLRFAQAQGPAVPNVQPVGGRGETAAQPTPAAGGSLSPGMLPSGQAA